MPTDLEQVEGILAREQRAYWALVSDEQRREAGCLARQAVVIQRSWATHWLEARCPSVARCSAYPETASGSRRPGLRLSVTANSSGG